MPTEKLYWADPFAVTFDARGARAGKLGDRASIVLARTAFYPEAGGRASSVMPSAPVAVGVDGYVVPGAPALPWFGKPPRK